MFLIKIDIVDYKNEDFHHLCYLLEEEHVRVIKEQRSLRGNCLSCLEEFSYVFIAYHEQKAVGCIAMKNPVNGVIELGRLYVLPEYRNLGVATKLLKVIIKKAKQMDGVKLILDTYERFESAVKLYEKFGFKKIAIIEKYYNNIHTAIVMQLTFNIVKLSS